MKRKKRGNEKKEGENNKKKKEGSKRNKMKRIEQKKWTKNETINP